MALQVKLTNADKVLYPATGTTKAQIFDYYTGLAEVMLPHIAGRPATRKRWPNGVDEPSFFEKQLAASAPALLPQEGGAGGDCAEGGVGGRGEAKGGGAQAGPGNPPGVRPRPRRGRDDGSAR